MLLNLFNVIYVLVAIAMIAMILLQRGAGAQAGSGFGGGASNTVFGARGAATFLTRSTAMLAGVFFLLSLGMGIYLGGANSNKPADDLGVMGGAEVPVAPAPAPTTGGDVPAVPGDDKAATPAGSAEKPAAGDAPVQTIPPATDKSAAPVVTQPVSTEPAAAPKKNASGNATDVSASTLKKNGKAKATEKPEHSKGK